MAKYELKTKVTDTSVLEFLERPENEAKYNDSMRLIEIMQEASGEEPKMWGPSIIGFGQYHYKYASGHEGDMCKIGFSPRKDAFSLYLYFDKTEKQELLFRLGKHKAAKGCFYIKKLSDIDENVLKEMIEKGIKHFSLDY